MAVPNATVEIALDSGYLTPAASRTWTDVTTKVEGQIPISITRGRGDQWSAPQPSRLTLTLDNSDGRFTPEYTAGAYYPNIKKGRPIRVRVTPAATVTDSFNRTDNAATLGSADTGQAWAVTNGGGAASVAGVISNTGYFSTANGGSWATLDAGAADVSVQVTMTAAYTNAGLVWRYSNTSNSFFMSKTVATRRLGGVETTVLTFSTPFTTGDTIKVVTSGNNHEVFRNGASVGTFVDANMNTATKHGLFSSADTTPRFEDFSVIAGAASYRVLGYVDEWPVEWPDGTSAMSTVTISATSRQGRLGKNSPFRSIVEEEIGIDLPALCFPLGEPSGATTAGNIAPGRSEVLTSTQIGTGGTLTFGAGTGPGTDDLTAPVFTPVDTSNGRHLMTTLTRDPTAVGDHVLEVEAYVTNPTTGPATTQAIAVLRGAANDTGMSLHTNTGTNKAVLTFGPNGAGASIAVTSTNVVRDGLLHHIVGRATLSDAGTVSVDLIVDGVKDSGSVAWAYMSSGVAFFPSMTVLSIGAGALGSGPSTPNGSLFSGTIAHVGVYSHASTAITDARFSQHYTAGSTGFSGEASGARIARYARLAGIPTAEVSVETGLSTSIAHKDTTGETPVAMMQAVAETEDGVVFDGKDGTLTFHARSHRYGAVSAFTLSCTAGDVEGGIKPTLDDQHITNDMTASRSGGVTIRSTNAASITEYGYYKNTVEILTTSDNEVQARADWEVNRFGTPRATIPNFGVDLTSCPPTLQAALLAADIGTKFTVTGLPSQAPASTMDFFIEGISERIGAVSYYMEFNVSPAAYANVWQLDSATYSQLDSTTVLAY